MTEINKILDHWKKDSVIDQTEPSKELLRIPVLHSKYLELLVEYKLLAKKQQFEYQKMKKLKWEYYTGKLDQHQLEELGWEPFQFTLKSDISTYLESDKDLIDILKKKCVLDECVNAIEAIMSELKSRTFQLRDFIAWERFIGGQ